MNAFMRPTFFYFVTKKQQFNELLGIVKGSKVANVISVALLNPVEGDFFACSIRVMSESSIGHAIKDAFRVNNVTYSFKSNSLNFTIGELPFQTYESFITSGDASLAVQATPNKNLKLFEDCIHTLLGHFPEPIASFINLRLFKISNGIFCEKEFFKELTVDNPLGLAKEDLSRLWNQMLYIEAMVERIPKAREFIQAYQTHEEAAKNLLKLRASSNT